MLASLMALALATTPATFSSTPVMIDGPLHGTQTAPAPASDAKAPVALIIAGSGPTDRDGNNPLGVKGATYRLLAEALAAKGITTVRADKRGQFESAPADAERYANLVFGKLQGTGGSSAIANSWLQLRDAGAKARAMLITAAASEWHVPESELTVSKGVVSHAPSKRQATFGSLVKKASALPLPEKVTLKDPKNFTLIGKEPPRVDVAAKCDGTAQFSIDFGLPMPARAASPPLGGFDAEWFAEDKAESAVVGNGFFEYAAVDSRSGVLWASLDHGHWGQKLQRSANMGADWQELAAPKYPDGAMLKDDKPATLRYLWVIGFGAANQPGRIYFGTEPGGLFVSDDGGESCRLVESLWNHPSRATQWMGGGRDEAGIHSIVVDPRGPAHERRVMEMIDMPVRKRPSNPLAGLILKKLTDACFAASTLRTKSPSQPTPICNLLVTCGFPARKKRIFLCWQEAERVLACPTGK